MQLVFLLLLCAVVIGVATAPGAMMPNPGSAGGTFQIKIRQTWSQEPAGYDRTAMVKVPSTSAGQKLPLVIDLHGAGGQGHVERLGYLGEGVVIAAADGYERTWNINAEPSQADDVSFLLQLIEKVTSEYPAADKDDVTIVGTSNGAAMIYRLLIVTSKDRPFNRVLPMVSSLISPQWREGHFWKSAIMPGVDNDYSAPAELEFADNFEYAHFHGTEDGTIKYEGASPGPPFLGDNVDVIAAQKTDFLFARELGFTGAQLADSAGVVPAEAGCDNYREYTYLGGRARHFKDIGGTHGSVFGHQCAKHQVAKALGLA